ncbi:OmpA family protein [Romboutsia sp. 1001713B170207_170306_H8]|uniref:OmpA family protein n=1 Tax=Romboutsia sp. 1001713B170207_170306_H8 TaxID=2787112 RepID=UPI000820F5F7|nr:OmpA family protein [Romboutsia sp. 1001713B170207_170306_H8]SCH44120.1 flagellar motor protein MotB [uncultured Clostridium sp.]
MSKLDKFKRKKKTEENGFSSISDLMSGLMIIFLFISVAFMSRVVDENIKIKKQQETVENIVETYEENKVNLYYDLYNEFKSDMNGWDMEIDKDGTIRFKEPDVYFEKGKSELKDEFKEILNSFFPRYIKLVYDNYKDNVNEIRIEGHTSSEWEENSTKKESYFGNMELSQDRTRNVLNYVMNMDELQVYEDWLIDNITANGMSYSKRILKEDNTEDESASRRVEFKIITNSEETINDILDNYNE